MPPSSCCVSCWFGRHGGVEQGGAAFRDLAVMCADATSRLDPRDAWVPACTRDASPSLTPSGSCGR